LAGGSSREASLSERVQKLLDAPRGRAYRDDALNVFKNQRRAPEFINGYPFLGDFENFRSVPDERKTITLYFQYFTSDIA
jgi:hypothetical protein